MASLTPRINAAGTPALPRSGARQGKAMALRGDAAAIGHGLRWRRGGKWFETVSREDKVPEVLGWD